MVCTRHTDTHRQGFWIMDVDLRQSVTMTIRLDPSEWVIDRAAFFPPKVRHTLFSVARFVVVVQPLSLEPGTPISARVSSSGFQAWSQKQGGEWRKLPCYPGFSIRDYSIPGDIADVIQMVYGDRPPMPDGLALPAVY